MPRKKLPPLTPEQIQLATLSKYLGECFPDPHHRGGFETTVERAIDLLRKLRQYEEKEKADNQYAQNKLDEARANAVKGAVARLIGGYGKQLSTDDLKKQCAQMLGDDKFWRDLSTLAWSQEEMKKMLGPYAY